MKNRSYIENLMFEHAKKERAELEKEFAEKLEAIRNVDLLAEATIDENMDALLGKLSKEEREEVDIEAGYIAEGYKDFLELAADVMENPDLRAKFFEELKKFA